MLPEPAPVGRAIAKLGADLSLARRRRRFTQVSMAQRTGASVSTIRRMEHGDGRVPLHFYARALHVLGALPALEAALDTENDLIGLALMDQQVPQRVRRSKSKVAW